MTRLEADTTLIANGRVYDHNGDTDQPSVADILIRGSRIERIERDLASSLVGSLRPDRTIDARDRLILPGFVNSHYHSHDVLLRGAFEAGPLDLWLLRALPFQYPPRSHEELRARTLIGAAECLTSGITTIQDMLTIHPPDSDRLDTVLSAYDEAGIRVVVSLQFGDLQTTDRLPLFDELIPPPMRQYLSAYAPAEPTRGSPLERAMTEYHRIGSTRRLHWALGPTNPLFTSEGLLRETALLADEYDLPILTHCLESPSEVDGSRHAFGDHGGSVVRYMDHVGLLGPRLAMAHGVWLSLEEIRMSAASGASIVMNPASNFKSRSGMAPAHQLIESGVNLALGCDNCSSGDVQNMFLAMRLLIGLSAASRTPDPPPSAADAIRFATEGGARAVGLPQDVGAVGIGMKADLTLLKLSSLSFLPLNSAARQIVFTEMGSAVDTVLVDGRIVVRDGELLTVDLSELQSEVEELHAGLKADLARVVRRTERVAPLIRAAWQGSRLADDEIRRYLV